MEQRLAGTLNCEAKLVDLVALMAYYISNNFNIKDL